MRQNRIHDVYILIREVKTLYSFLRELCEQWRMKFGTAKAYLEDQSRKIKKKLTINKKFVLNIHVMWVPHATYFFNSQFIRSLMLLNDICSRLDPVVKVYLNNFFLLCLSLFQDFNVFIVKSVMKCRTNIKTKPCYLDTRSLTVTFDTLLLFPSWLWMCVPNHAYTSKYYRRKQRIHYQTCSFLLVNSFRS